MLEFKSIVRGFVGCHTLKWILSKILQASGRRDYLYMDSTKIGPGQLFVAVLSTDSMMGPKELKERRNILDKEHIIVPKVGREAHILPNPAPLGNNTLGFLGLATLPSELKALKIYYSNVIAAMPCATICY